MSSSKLLENKISGADARKHDRIFTDTSAPVADFRFGSETAAVFDDMVSRSVPYYREIQRMVCELAADFASKGSIVYDLGCSTGTTLLAMDPMVEPDVRFVGIDNSEAMLKQARRKFDTTAPSRSVEFLCADLEKCPVLQDASVVTLVLTLQFIRPLFRERLVRRIRQDLVKNGCLILVEKLTMSDSTLNRLFINHYYDMKRRNGYSEMEIARKREALENVLIPYRPEENRDLLLDCGFRSVEEFFRWYNFSAIIAVA